MGHSQRPRGYVLRPDFRHERPEYGHVIELAAEDDCRFNEEFTESGERTIRRGRIIVGLEVHFGFLELGIEAGSR
ncbi:hypothetical protein ColTof4_08030 [Colletotrichum tofieldiae]|nr:hypothetical protein ColTof3_02445 [Colletotrichum tofieldiae]GKT75607.1 hypothetical protein ColTof4_08030 [Colletotrichum tofieldiae]